VFVTEQGFSMEDEMDQYDEAGKSVHLLLNTLEDSQVEGEKKRVPIGVVRIITAKNKVGLRKLWMVVCMLKIPR
jgi:hypothetical protein